MNSRSLWIDICVDSGYWEYSQRISMSLLQNHTRMHAVQSVQSRTQSWTLIVIEAAYVGGKSSLAGKVGKSFRKKLPVIEINNYC